MSSPQERKALASALLASAAVVVYGALVAWGLGKVPTDGPLLALYIAGIPVGGFAVWMAVFKLGPGR